MTLADISLGYAIALLLAFGVWAVYVCWPRRPARRLHDQYAPHARHRKPMP